MVTRNRRILYVLGTPPNFAKMAPVIAEMRRRLPQHRHVLVSTERDHDRPLYDLLRDELSIPEPTYLLGTGSGGHAGRTAYLMERLERVLELESMDVVVAPGDGDGALAATLAAVQLGIRTARIEAGLRSFDRTMPEEVNRVVADEFASVLFADSDEAVENLLAQGIDAEDIHQVGNTLIDSLVALEGRFRELGASRTHGFAPGSYLLGLLRGSAVATRGSLWNVLDGLRTLSQQLPVLLPVEPEVRSMAHGHPLSDAIHLIPAPDYLSQLSLEAGAAAVLTDVGEVQEETTHLDVPCFTLRDVTERPITVRHGTNTLLGRDPARIPDILTALEEERPIVEPPSTWDGHAAERVADVLETTLESGSSRFRRKPGEDPSTFPTHENSAPDVEPANGLT